VLPQHPLDHLGLVGAVVAAQRGDDCLDVHPTQGIPFPPPKALPESVRL
jgi:hypothetical protein